MNILTIVCYRGGVKVEELDIDIGTELKDKSVEQPPPQKVF